VNYDPGRLFAISFLFLSIGSAVYVSVATVNYLSLYPALGQIQIQVVSLSFTQSPSINQSSLTAVISVSNPAEYSGLEVGDVSAVASLYVNTNQSITLFTGANQLSAERIGLDQLRPNSTYSESISFKLSPQQITEIVSFISNYKGEVMAVIYPTVDVVTFLQSVTGPVQYTQTQYLSLSTS
jgi:hypothetical protein